MRKHRMRSCCRDVLPVPFFISCINRQPDQTKRQHTLREKKKQAYAAYHQAQDEMRQLLTVRANVERILGVEEKEKERQKEKKKER